MANLTGKKFGGRQKGTKNKRSQDFEEKYEKFAIKYADPVEVLFSMVADEVAELPIRRAAASDLLQYRFNKLKAVEHSGEIDTGNANELTEDQIIARLAEIADGEASIRKSAKDKTSKKELH